MLQWLKYGPFGVRPEVYLNGPELADYLREAGHEQAAGLVEAQVREIEQQPPGSIGVEGPS